MVLTRTVYRDIAAYNNPEDREDFVQESGWKLVHGDVFRCSTTPGFLAVFLRHRNTYCDHDSEFTAFCPPRFYVSCQQRWDYSPVLLLLWVLTSSFCGFVAARLYNDLNGNQQKKLSRWLVVFSSRGWCFQFFFLLNLILMLAKSTASVSFFTLLLFASTVVWNIGPIESYWCICWL